MSRGSGSIFKRGRIWHVQVCVDGQVIRQSSHSTKYGDAKKLRDKLLGQKARGELGGYNSHPAVNSVLDHYLKDQALHVRAETLKIEKLVVDSHLRLQFGHLKAEKVTTDALLEYRRVRTREGASPATCNRELSYLRTALRTASRTTPPMIPPASIPHFPIVSENAFARQGFIEDDAFRKVLVKLPSYLIPLTVVAYNTGIRRGELLRVEWDQVDFAGGTIRLYRGRTKTGDPRIVPMIDKMRDVLLQARAERDVSWPECSFVFSRLGQPIRSFKNAWAAACKRAGYAGLQFHDLRRSGARNLSRAGVPERVIMSITGHKTRAMFDRYNIVSESDLAEAAAKMEAYRESRNAAEEGSTPKSTDTISDTAAPDEGSK